MVVFSQVILNEFDSHSEAVRKRARQRQEAVRLRATVDDNSASAGVDIRDTLGTRLPQDNWEGCTNLRTLRTLLSLVDDRGFERSPHQMAFHSSFERCVSRVIYKKDWATARPAIMKHNKWDKCSSEVLISTPRRFGKTFRRVTLTSTLCSPLPTLYSHHPLFRSIAIFAACLALSFGCEIVVFVSLALCPYTPTLC